MKGLLFDQENKERIIYQDDLKITCRHFFTLPWDARATDGACPKVRCIIKDRHPIVYRSR